MWNNIQRRVEVAVAGVARHSCVVIESHAGGTVRVNFPEIAGAAIHRIGLADGRRIRIGAGILPAGYR